MTKFIIPPIAETIENRKRKYNDLIQKAEDINQKAQLSLQQYEKMLATARLEANAQIKVAEEELSILLSQNEQEKKQELEQKMNMQEAILSAQREKMLKQVDNLSSDLAYMIVQKLKLPSITPADINEASQKSEVQ